MQPSEIQTSKLLDSPLPKIKMALTQAAMFRGAKLDASTISLYSSRLAQEPFEDVIAALEKIAEMPRKDYEPALPEIGTVLGMVDVMRTSRENREKASRDNLLAQWRCPNCRYTQAGFISLDDCKPRYCRRCTKPMLQTERQKYTTQEVA